MAEGTGPKKSLHDLRQEIAHSRDRLARDLSGVRYELNFPLKFRKSFQRSTGAWLAGAAVLGLLYTVVPRKKKVVVEARRNNGDKKGILEAGFAIAALKFVGTLLRPAITSYVASKLGGRPGMRR